MHGTTKLTLMPVGDGDGNVRTSRDEISSLGKAKVCPISSDTLDTTDLLQ